MISERRWREWTAVTLDHDGLRLIVPLAFGPRVLFFGAAEGENLLHRFEDEEGAGPDGNYLFRGGHRLWHAPEDPVRTYQPDNDALKWEAISETSFRVRAPVEPKTALQKEIKISACGPKTFRLVHRLTNHGVWAIETAPWGLTVLPPGGIGMIPLPPKGEHPRDLLPGYSFVPWAYTDFSLPGWRFHQRFLSLDTRQTESPQKAGAAPGCCDWLAYWRNETLFVKRTIVFPERKYPDLGCATEIFSDGSIMELETLGPLGMIAPGESVCHTEEWTIFDEMPEPVDDEIWETKILLEVEAWKKCREAEGPNQ